MKAVMVMYDSLNKQMLSSYGCDETITPNFERLKKHSVQFDTCYAGSLPCMPARRELHTGRYNFLHRSWGPIEPFDDSMPEILKRNGVYSHLISDHTHYWEDGGATYHTRYSSWEGFRGQEGDPWKAVVGDVPDENPNLIEFDSYRGLLYKQDLINRSHLQDELDHPQVKCFDSGLEFIDTNAKEDKWFLQIETFDPHEPFFCYDKYKNMYPSGYEGPRFDWPDYAAVKETPEQVEEGRRSYKALLTMCDMQLGKVLDKFDELNLWEDTMLIVCTDHGYLLGEHGYWAKNYMPLYDEISNTPLFIWDPRYKVKDETRDELVQMIDIPATLLDFFDLDIPKDMEGKPIAPVISERKSIRDYGLFGIHGGHVCCTDGDYVYMKAPEKESGYEIYEYTLMPTHMPCFFSADEIKTMEKHEGFDFTKGMPVMRFNAQVYNGAYKYGDILFDRKNDKKQNTPIKDSEVETRMKKAMKELMEENDAPSEQFSRIGL